MRNFIERYVQYFNIILSGDVADTEFSVSLRKIDSSDDEEDDINSSYPPLDRSNTNNNDDDEDGNNIDDDNDLNDNDNIIAIPPTPPANVMTYAVLEALSVKELKDLLRTKALKISGSKSELIERYIDSQKIEQDKYDEDLSNYELNMKMKLEKQLQQQRIHYKSSDGGNSNANSPAPIFAYNLREKKNNASPDQGSNGLSIVPGFNTLYKGEVKRSSPPRSNLPTLTKEENDQFNVVEKYIIEFIKSCSPYPASSREIGRYLQSKKVGDVTALAAVKNSFGGLFQFLKT